MEVIGERTGRGALGLLTLATLLGAYQSAISVVSLKEIAVAFDVSHGRPDAIVAPIASLIVGAAVAVLLCRLADRSGRRRMLIASLTGTIVFGAATAAAPNLGTFVASQFLSRVFVVTLFALAVTVAAEEQSPRRRGSAIGWLVLAGASGLPAAAVTSRFGFRVQYAIVLAGWALVPVLASRLRSVDVEEARERARSSNTATLFQLGSIHALVNFALLGAITWFPYHLTKEQGASRSSANLLVAIAYGFGLAGIVVAGRMQDRYGRRRTATLFMIGALVMGAGAFETEPRVIVTPLLMAATFFGFGVLPVIAALSAELFPRSNRAAAVGLMKGIFTPLGAMLGPALVGILGDEGIADSLSGIGVIGDLGHAMTIAALALVPAIALVQSLPETAARDLENISLAAAKSELRTP